MNACAHPESAHVCVEAYDPGRYWCSECGAIKATGGEWELPVRADRYAEAFAAGLERAAARLEEHRSRYAKEGHTWCAMSDGAAFIRALLPTAAPQAPPRTEEQARAEERERGLYRKFSVERADGSSGEGRKHEFCEYFVLDWSHDPFTIPAVRAYAVACEASYPELAKSLRALAASYGGPAPVDDTAAETHQRALHDHIDLDLLRVRAKQTSDDKLSGRGAAICMYAAADEIERRDRLLAASEADVVIARDAERIARLRYEGAQAAERATRLLLAASETRARALEEVLRAQVDVLIRLQRAASDIQGATSCPDPSEGGCIGGPVRGLGCLNEGARFIYRRLDEVIEKTSSALAKKEWT